MCGIRCMCLNITNKKKAFTREKLNDVKKQTNKKNHNIST